MCVTKCKHRTLNRGHERPDTAHRCCISYELANAYRPWNDKNISICMYGVRIHLCKMVCKGMHTKLKFAASQSSPERKFKSKVLLYTGKYLTRMVRKQKNKFSKRLLK